MGEPFYQHYHGSSLDLSVTHEYIEAFLEPFLNPGAVQAAGLSATAILEWADAHPGEVFNHPTYASLCLRWGENVHGYRVEEAEEPALTPEAVPFTPHTCWESGTTYYEWAGELAADWEKIRMTARLQDHVREIGREGRWRGSYTTDRRALDQALAQLGRNLVLTQSRRCYGVFMDESSEVEVIMTADTAEEALAYFAGLPTVPRMYRGSDTNGVHVCFGDWLQKPGHAPKWTVLCEKYVLVPEEIDSHLDLKDYLNSYGAGSLALTKMRNFDLCEYDQNTLVDMPLVTLASVLATTGLIRWRLAEALGLTAEELSARERDPGRLTLTEVGRVSKLTQRPVAQLLLDLREEVHARTTMAQRAQQELQRSHERQLQ